jgi:SAM-dependent methyltransferase
MTLYALTIFSSAFLLFLVQPLLAKQILPWFGGSAAVWSTCLVFFQSVLLLGYAYSDWTSRNLAPRRQAILHIALLAVSVLLMPIVANAAWKPQGNQDPTVAILGLLVTTIGLPYLLLSTTGPLVQAWLARRQAGPDVYRLFALSNLASLVALLSYPFAIEPWVTARVQSLGWSAGYTLFAVLCASTAVVSLRAIRPAAVASEPVPTASAPGSVAGQAPRAGAWAYARWVFLSALASASLLAITNHITHDVASVPFLWLVPLTLYLLSFILTFEGRGWYRRKLYVVPVLALVAGMAWSLQESRNLYAIRESVALFAFGLFAVCMFCHGELADSKPEPSQLTRFYLAISIGGTVGGILVGLVAPRVFTAYYELPLCLTLAAIACLAVIRRMHILLQLAMAGAAAFAGYQLYEHTDDITGTYVHSSRSFYGTLRVQERRRGDDPVRQLMHGVILHGEQYTGPQRRFEPTTYYGATSGIGRTLEVLGGTPLRVGVVGLGTGTIAAYGRAGDVYRFYELDPAVAQVARTHFTFLGDSKARTEIVLGDARLTMEREPPQQYDVIAIDAFSSDSIPVHLLSSQALAVYLRHLKPQGVLAFHVSNRFLRLAPVLKNVAEAAGLKVARVVDDPEGNDLSSTEWVLVSRDAAVLAKDRIVDATEDIDEIPGLGVWTDDSNNLFRILK